MTSEQLTMLFEEIINKIDSGPGSHLDILVKTAEKSNIPNEFEEIFLELSNSLASVRLILKYLNFDLEVTRRERDELRTIVEDKEP